jgi:AcrR family transcriptional regulator
MAEIARRAGIATSVISYHFEDKIELMLELVRTAVTHTMTLAQRADPAADLASYARELATVFDLATRPLMPPAPAAQ